MKSYGVTIHMKAIVQYFPQLLFIALSNFQLYALIKFFFEVLVFVMITMV